MAVADAYTLGARLKEFRKAKKLSQKKLADIVGTTKQSFGRWEYGQCFPSTYYVPLLCKVLGVSPNQLFGWEEE